MNNAATAPPTESIDSINLKLLAGLTGACASVYAIGCSDPINNGL